VRPPKRPFVSGPGPLSPTAEAEKAHLRRGHLEFYDPAGATYGMPTYRWGMVPAHLLTRRQLRARGLRMGGQPIQAQMIWWHGGRRLRNGRSCRERRVAWLYDVNLALPVRPMTEARWRAHAQAMIARMTCKTCGVVQDYCISKHYGECNTCVDRQGCAA
jgi:hypothetical protein